MYECPVLINFIDVVFIILIGKFSRHTQSGIEPPGIDNAIITTLVLKLTICLYFE